MNMRKRIVAPLIAAVLITSLSIGTAFAESTFSDRKVDGNTIERTYYNTDKDFSADKKITYNGKSYTLKDTREEKDTKKQVTKKVTTDDKDKFNKTISEVIDGEEVTLVADTKNIDWKDIPKEETLYEVREYGSRNEVPNSVSVNGNTYSLESVAEGTRITSFTAPATFTSPDTTSNVYYFNGNLVTISGGSPVWSGYQSDVKSYLGYDCTITGGSWNGAAVKRGDSYVRTATYSGTRVTPLFTATYSYTSENQDDVTYEADVTYVAKTVVATYTSGISTIVKVVGGAAELGVFALALALVIKRLRKKDEEEEEDEI